MDTNWVLRRMRRLGITQKFLAYKLGLTPSALNHKLHGRRPTTLREGAILARWLQLSAEETCSYLLFGQKVA